MAQYAYVLADKKALVFCSWKAGSTSMTNWLADIMGVGYSRRQDIKLRALERRKRRALEATLPVVEAAESLRLIREEGFTDFVMTRNPYRRAASAFVEKFLFYEDQREPMDRLSGLKGFARIAFLAEMARQGKPSSAADYEGDKYTGISFVEMLEYLRSKVQTPDEATGEPDLNAHWNLQVPLYFDRAGFDFSNIIRLERASEDIAPLARVLGTEVPFPHARRNKLEGFTVVSDQDLSNIRSVELIRAGIIPSSKALINDHTIALIREIYATDFRKLGYGLEEY